MNKENKMKPKTFNDSPIQLSIEQHRFADFVLSTDERIVQLWGGPGTGKSTVLKWLIGKLDDSVIISACSNAAANELGGLTVHRAIGVYPLDMGSSYVGTDSILAVPENPKDLSAKILIVDEASMINEELYQHILNTNPKRLILVGDKEQIKPVKSKPAVFPAENIYTFETNHRAKTTELKDLNEGMRGQSHASIMERLPKPVEANPIVHCMDGGTYIPFTNKEVVRVSDALIRDDVEADFYFKSSVTARIGSLCVEGEYPKVWRLPKEDPVYLVAKRVTFVIVKTSTPIKGFVNKAAKYQYKFPGESDMFTFDSLLDGISEGSITIKIATTTTEISWHNMVEGNYGLDSMLASIDIETAENRALKNLQAGYSVGMEECKVTQAIMMCMAHKLLRPLSELDWFTLKTSSPFVHLDTYKNWVKSINKTLTGLKQYDTTLKLVNKLSYFNCNNYSKGALIVQVREEIDISINLYEDEATGIYIAYKKLRRDLRSSFIAASLPALFGAKFMPLFNDIKLVKQGLALGKILFYLSFRTSEEQDDMVYAKRSLFDKGIFENVKLSSTGALSELALEWIDFILQVPAERAQQLNEAFNAMQGLVLQMENIPAARDYRCMTSDMSQGKTIPHVMLNVHGMNAQRLYVGASRASEKLTIIDKG